VGVLFLADGVDAEVHKVDLAALTAEHSIVEEKRKRVEKTKNLLETMLIIKGDEVMRTTRRPPRVCVD